MRFTGSVAGALAAIVMLVTPVAGAAEYLPEVEQAIGQLPSVTPGQGWSLRDLIKVTSERNVTLEMMRSEVEKAHWQMASSWALIMPMAEAGLAYTRADHEDSMNLDVAGMLKPYLEPLGVQFPDTPAEPTVIRRVDDLKGSLTVSMSLINVQSWYTIAMAKSGEELAKLSFEQVRQQLLSGVTQAYLGALMAKTVIGLQESQVDSAAHHLDVAIKRFRSGAGLKIDVVRAEADLVSAKQELLNAHLAYESARDALGLLSGVGGLPVPVESPEIAPSPAIETASGSLSGTVSERFDVRLNTTALELARRDFGTSWGAYLPTVVGGWGGTYQFTEPASFGSEDRSRWNLFLSVTVPIFEFHKIGQIKQKKFAVKSAELKLEDSKLAAAKEIREASRQYRTAVANEAISRKQVELATEALELVESAYQAGAGSSLEVTDARRNRSAAEVGAATAKLRVQMALLGFHVASGAKVEDVTGGLSGR